MSTFILLSLIFVCQDSVDKSSQEKVAKVGDEEGWVELFDGKTLKGWKASEDKESFKVVDGAIVTQAKPNRSHLFYVGLPKEKGGEPVLEPFVNFIFEAEVMTFPGANAGIYFHSKYQEKGWPKYGYEAQVNATHGDPKKTASLYDVKNCMKAPHEDEKWFTYRIHVEGRKITFKIDGKVAMEYEEPKDKKPGKNFTRKLDKGTFAFQAHDPKSKVLFRKIRVKRLPGNESPEKK